MSADSLQIIFDLNTLDMVQIFKSMLMVIHLYKIEISKYFTSDLFSIFITG